MDDFLNYGEYIQASINSPYLNPKINSVYFNYIHDFDRRILVDANIEPGYIKAIDSSRLYTTNGVARENSYWADNISEDHKLDSYAQSDFRNNGGMVQLTGPDLYDDSVTTVYYNAHATTVTCECCGIPTTATLTNAYGTTVYICQRLSSTDVGLLVWTLAFPDLKLFTHDKCLGWSSAKLGSVTVDDSNTRLIYWDHKLKYLNNARRKPN